MRIAALFLTLISFISVAQEYQKDTATVNFWFSQANEYASTDFKKSILYADSARDLSLKVKYPLGHANAELYKGLAHDYAGNFSYADSLYNKALEEFTVLKDTMGIGRSYSNLGVLNYYSGNADEAVKYYLKANKYFKHIGYSKGVASNLNNLGLIARANFDYNKALKYYKESIRYKKEMNDTLGEITTLKNVSTMYFYMEDYKSANKYNEQCIELSKAIKDKGYIAECLTDKAIYLNKMDDSRNEEAKGYLYQSQEDLLTFKRYKTLCINLAALGYIYLEEEKIDSAEYFLSEARSINDQLNVSEYELEILRGESQLYELKGEWNKAYKSLEAYLSLYKDIAKKSRSAEVKNLEAKYNFLEQSSKIDNLNERQKVANLKIEQSNFNQLILWIAVILMLLVMGYVIYLNRIMKQQKEQLSNALSDKDTLLKEIHHRVKNNLQMVSSLLYLQSDSIKDDKALEALTTSRTRVDAMSIIHQKLYKEDNLKGVSTKEYIDDLIEGIIEALDLDETEITFNQSIEEHTLDIDTTIPIGLIINELITNALKHAFSPEQEEKKIDIELRMENDYLFVRVADNGEGNHQFNPNHSTGFGQRLIDMFVKKLKGTKEVIKDKGYAVEIKFHKFKIV